MCCRHRRSVLAVGSRIALFRVTREDRYRNALEAERMHGFRSLLAKYGITRLRGRWETTDSLHAAAVVLRGC